MSGGKTDKFVVVKRDGREEPVMFDKITTRIQKLCYNLDMNHIEPSVITFKVINGIYPGVTTAELDNLAAETAATMTTKHPDYAILAARIAVSNLHKETRNHKSFSDTVEILHNSINPITGKHSSLIAEDTYEIIMKNKEKLNSAIVYSRDYDYTYFGFKTLERSYLMKVNGKVVERPQHLLMRVSVGIHGCDIDRAIETYNCMSEKLFTHATPTLFNSGTPRPQLSSCFLISMKDDSIDGIFDTLKTCSLISKYAGGVGVHMHQIRASGSYIAGTNGFSNGIVPLLRVYNNASRYVDQGGNKRPGSFAIYIEPWHADIFDFLDLRKNTGNEEVRARDLFYALWIPDLFMRRVKNQEKWSLMCPHECPGLSDCYGEEFDKLYASYESQGKARVQIDAQKLWFAILDAQIETGTPYMLYKDACNLKSNQKNVGTIKSSNLCGEVVEYSDPSEVAVCNLASIALNMFVVVDKITKEISYDFQKLHKCAKILTRNLDRVIDVNFYPVPEAKKSNMRHRPIGIGVQGLADAFIMMRFPFDSQGARDLNIKIFETIYHGACEASCELAIEYGKPYETYEGSPASQGLLQCDLWGVTPSDMWNWPELREKVVRHGIRNSLFVASMPTASTSQILGNNESTEPYTSNIYTRRVLSGEFQVVNRHLLKDLVDLGIWNESVKNQLIADNGSVQRIAEIPSHLKSLYRTAWELKMRTLIDMAADRSPYIDQSQSLNLFVPEPNHKLLTSMHFYAWSKGLKTGMYYLRTKPGANAIQFTVDQKLLSQRKGEKDKEESAEERSKRAILCSIENRENCVMCSA